MTRVTCCVSRMIIAFNKPYVVISQFTQKEEGHRTLKEFKFPRENYPLGRLDMDSEGLLLLSDEKDWIDDFLHPRHAHKRTYHVQVDGQVTENAVLKLRKGVLIPTGKTLPCDALILNPAPDYWARVPPIRVRLAIPTSWLELKLIEGKNRQVRRMTAAVGFPTLRLIRSAIGSLTVTGLAPGEWRVLNGEERLRLRGIR